MNEGAGYGVRVAGCRLRGELKCRTYYEVFIKRIKLQFVHCIVLLLYMNSYRDLEIYRLSFDLAVRVHKASLKLPKFELFEQGSQIRRSSKSIKDQIAEGYGRRRYKADFIKFLVYSHASCDEALSQLEMMIILYPELTEFNSLSSEYEILGRKINSFIDYVDNNWRT
jgi:four helix bundle protein